MPDDMPQAIQLCEYLLQPEHTWLRVASKNTPLQPVKVVGVLWHTAPNVPATVLYGEAPSKYRLKHYQGHIPGIFPIYSLVFQNKDDSYCQDSDELGHHAQFFIENPRTDNIPPFICHILPSDCDTSLLATFDPIPVPSPAFNVQEWKAHAAIQVFDYLALSLQYSYPQHGSLPEIRCALQPTPIETTPTEIEQKFQQLQHVFQLFLGYAETLRSFARQYITVPCTFVFSSQKVLASQNNRPSIDLVFQADAAASPCLTLSINLAHHNPSRMHQRVRHAVRITNLPANTPPMFQPGTTSDLPIVLGEPIHPAIRQELVNILNSVSPLFQQQQHQELSC